jgi:hypothetical protein
MTNNARPKPPVMQRATVAAAFTAVLGLGATGVTFGLVASSQHAAATSTGTSTNGSTSGSTPASTSRSGTEGDDGPSRANTSSSSSSGAGLSGSSQNATPHSTSSGS